MTKIELTQLNTRLATENAALRAQLSELRADNQAGCGAPKAVVPKPITLDFTVEQRGKVHVLSFARNTQRQEAQRLVQGYAKTKHVCAMAAFA